MGSIEIAMCKKSIVLGLVCGLFFWGCAPKQETVMPARESLAVEKVAWEYFDLTQADTELFFQTFLKSCHRNALTKPFCALEDFNAFQEAFVPYKIVHKGLMTGYYEPTLRGSKTRSDVYAYPLYGKPEGLVSVHLESVYGELSGYRLRGKLEGTRVVPYYTHQEIDTQGVDAPVICYVNSKVDAFFLQIQGSGRVELEEGGVLHVGYADQNGHPYRAIGRYMRQQGYLEEVSMQSIRAFLKEHPHKADAIMHTNPSYVFFSENTQGATGALGVELTPYASVAVDRGFIPLGLPLWIETSLPFIQPLVVAQDVGGAIRGAARVDYFFGPGEAAAERAGGLSAPVTVYLFLPRGETTQR